MSAADEKVMAHVADVLVTNGKVHEHLLYWCVNYWHYRSSLCSRPRTLWWPANLFTGAATNLEKWAYYTPHVFSQPGFEGSSSREM